MNIACSFLPSSALTPATSTFINQFKIKKTQIFTTFNSIFFINAQRTCTSTKEETETVEPSDDYVIRKSL